MPSPFPSRDPDDPDLVPVPFALVDAVSYQMAVGDYAEGRRLVAELAGAVMAHRDRSPQSFLSPDDPTPKTQNPEN